MVVLLDLARAGVLRVLRVLRVVRVVRVGVWRRQALGRVGVMLLGECGQQLGWANKRCWLRLGRQRCRNKQTTRRGVGGKVRYKKEEAQAQRPGCGAGQR